MNKNDFQRHVTIEGKTYTFFDIQQLSLEGIANIERLPFSIRILVENILRKLDYQVVKESDLITIANWKTRYEKPVEIPFYPSRVLMQDFTGVPAIVDLAAMRDKVKELGKNPEIVNPLVPVDLVIDHSVQVDYFGTDTALKNNVALEYQRNLERYQLLNWAKQSFSNIRIVPPNSGICHQVNLEYLAEVVMTERQQKTLIVYPDSVVGTDSHTTMINGLGVMGWGVGGIEAEAVMLGQPYFMPIPEVIGVRLIGEIKEGVTATDVVLSITQFLRNYKVVEKFVEFFGEGKKHLSVPDRATIANMSPEYGATMGFFPIDEMTIDYLKTTGRTHLAKRVEAYTKTIGLFDNQYAGIEYTDVLEFDLSKVLPCVAGPKRPHDRIILHDLGKPQQENRTSYSIECNGHPITLKDHSVVIAAITSCTNTSNPYVMIGAGLVAKKAVQKGLNVPNHVKTSLTPGSKAVLAYLEKLGLMPYFEALGFHVAGFGCATCIGNSGNLHKDIEALIKTHNLSVASVLSGNRNFEARVHQLVKENYLMSPMLVIAFALLGRTDLDITTCPIGIDPNGQPVYLKDIWPDRSEIESLFTQISFSELYRKEYADLFSGDAFWNDIAITKSITFPWDADSSYIKKPPYFDDVCTVIEPKTDIKNAKALLVLGDSVTTDHISPAGAIPAHYPAGQYLIEHNIKFEEFNSYGARRGNHEVMMRGTFGNIRIKNQLVSPKEGSYTLVFPEKETLYVYDAVLRYRERQQALIVLAGKEYGTGSSRDWAAKGTRLLGIQVVFAESFERIHKSNLVGMGVLPVQFLEGQGWASLGLNGSEQFSLSGIEDIHPRAVLTITALKEDGQSIIFQALARLDTEVDVTYFKHGGILPYVLRQLVSF
ncbi:MAG: aconitate hydratase AcnA [Desulfobacterales bacterium]|nr:aconitate hydratase AcnA [Desulfobacterales bacterium]